MSLTKDDIFVLIAAYNEERKIGRVIERVRAQGYHLHVVDDGSTDGTAAILRQFDISHEISVPNAGKGAALKKGFRHFLSGPHRALIVMDADGQHLPEELDHFLHALNATGADVVLGNRMHDPRGMSWVRVCTNRVMSGLLSWAAGCRMPDTQCGFRALTRRAVERIRIESDRFEAESEMLLEAVRHGLKIESTAVSSVYADEKSHIHPVRDTLRFFQFLFRALSKKR